MEPGNQRWEAGWRGLVQLQARNVRPCLSRPALPDAEGHNRGSRLWGWLRGAAFPPAWPGLNPTRPYIRVSPTFHPGGIRGPGAHLIFLADVDERRDTHGEGPGTVDVALPNHADRKRELGRAAALPSNRFRVTPPRVLRGGVIDRGGTTETNPSAFDWGRGRGKPEGTRAKVSFRMPPAQSNFSTVELLLRLWLAEPT